MMIASYILATLMSSCIIYVIEIAAVKNNITIEHLYDHSKRFQWVNTSWLGQPCDYTRYVDNMKPVWDIFLKNPDDPSVVDRFDEVLKLADADPDPTSFWASICFARSLESCDVKNKCACLHVMDKDFIIDQVPDGDHCGMKSKLHCRPWESLTGEESKKATNLSIDCEVYADCNQKGICECAVGLKCNTYNSVGNCLLPCALYFASFVLLFSL